MKYGIIDFISFGFLTTEDDRIKKLTNELGVEGYGIYCIFLNILSSNNGLPEKLDFEYISFYLDVSEDKIKKVVENYDLFIIDNGYFYSEDVIIWVKELDKKNNGGV